MKHIHPRSDELHVFFVPADSSEPCKSMVIPHDLENMQRLVEGYIEVVRTQQMPVLECGCPMAMVVNEEGLIYRLPLNSRASLLYPVRASIYGNAFLLGEGPVHTDEEGWSDVDFFSLPQVFSQWAGPGDPIPGNQRQPWEPVD